MKIYLIRHGKDDKNYRGGWSNLGLVSEGEQQAAQLARFLSEHKNTYPISKIITSDLKGRPLDGWHFALCHIHKTGEYL